MSSMNQTDALSRNPFLVQLATSFNVTSIPLAIFILVLICVTCLILLVLLILCVRTTIKRRKIKIIQKKRLRSVYMDEINTLEEAHGEQGQLAYSLEYMLPEETLHVIIGEAKNLQVPEGEKSLDVYATLKVVTEGFGKYGQIGKTHKTEIRRRTTFPRWCYSCEFKLKQEALGTTHLIFEVFDYDSIGQDKSIGILDVPLANMDPSKYVGSTLECVGCLKPGVPKFTGLGELCVGLTYNLKTERLEVHIYEARQLKLGNMLSAKKKHEICVYLEFRVKHRTVGAFESSPKTELTNPYFNEKSSFPLKKENLNDAYCICRLRRKGRFGRRHELGVLTIGPNAELSTGAKHWDEMIKNSPRTHVMWHTWTPKSFPIDSF